MQLLVIIIIVIDIIYILLKKRRFDFFSIMVFSGVVYYFPCIIGKLRDSEYSTGYIPIDSRVYACVFTYFFVLFVFLLVIDKYTIFAGDIKLSGPSISEKECITNDNKSNFAVLVLSFIALILAIYSVVYYGNFTLDFNKMKMLQKTNRLIEYQKYISLFCFSYMFSQNGKYTKIGRITSVIVIGYTFLLGHRSFIVIGIITIFMRKLGTYRKVRLISIINSYKGMFLGIFMAGLFFLFIKNIFAALMGGDYDLVMSRLTNPEYYMNSLLNSESNVILHNLQMSITGNVSYSIALEFMGIVMLIPVVGGRIASSLNYIGYEDILNIKFNSNLNEGIGLGSTYLGEGYALGGIIMLIIFLVFTFFLFSILQYKSCTVKCNITQIYLAICATYLSFYIHRNSLIFLALIMRAYLYIFILAIMIRKITIRKVRSISEYQKLWQ